MAQVTMYPANPGSPETTTSSETAIDATSIGITELGSFLAATNQVVLTDGTDFEVVVYSAKSAASGAGTITVSRSGTGHEGTAKVWPAGTRVYNSPTAYTFNTIKANVEDLDTNKQAADATLTALAGVTTAADKVPYFTAEDAAAVFDLPSNPNLIQNGGFQVNQRSVASVNSDGSYPVDRWLMNILGSGCVASQQVFAAGQTDVPGEPKNYLRFVVTSVQGADNRVVFDTRIESVRTLAGQHGVLSFYAKADAPKNIQVEFGQFFGAGGGGYNAPLNSNRVSLTSSWVKYSIPISIPSITGWTIGSIGDFFQTSVWLDAGSTYDSRTNSLGQQSGTFEFANVKLEAGTVATPFVAKPYAEELRDCQRYLRTFGGNAPFELIAVGMGALSASAGNIQIPLSPPMRVTPTLVAPANVGNFQLYDSINAGTVVTGGWTLSGAASPNLFVMSPTVAGGLTQFRPYNLIANNQITDRLILSSEL